MKLTIDNIWYYAVISFVKLLFSLKSVDAPSIGFQSKKFNVSEGEDVHLECVSDGRPLPTVTWSKIGGLSNVTYPPGQRLTIRNSNRTEDGTYRCTASNGIGRQATAKIDVNVFCKFIALGEPLILIAMLRLTCFSVLDHNMAFGKVHLAFKEQISVTRPLPVILFFYFKNILFFNTTFITRLNLQYDA